MLPTEVTTAELARLLGVSRRNFPGLAERKSIVPGSRKGTYALEPSISGYAKHLRRLAQGRHGTGETLSTAEVEALSTNGHRSGKLLRLGSIRAISTARVRYRLIPGVW